MDWSTGIQRALNYAEEHLTGEIDPAEAARAACSSPFHFQRMFTLLCGFTLGDYVRMRRLALAAEDLSPRASGCWTSRCATATTPPRASPAHSPASTA